MKRFIARLRVSPAMLVAMLALFVALSGTAVATTSALIGGNQIRNNSIAGIDVKNNSITGVDVKNKSLTARDFRGSIRGARGSAGPPGPPGAAGAAGAPGAAGTARGYARVSSTGVIDPASSKGVVSASIAGSSLICFELGYTPDSVIATVQGYASDHTGGPYGFVSSGRGAGTTVCPPTTDAYVATANTAGANTREPVFVMFNGGPAAAASAAPSSMKATTGSSNVRN